MPRSSSASPDRGARQIGGQNQVTRDLGGQPRTGDDWIDRCEVKLEEDDLLVLCSDGVHGVLESAGLFGRLREARKQATPPDVLAEELVALALAGGTRDNSTVVVVRCKYPAPTKESIWKKDILAWMKRKPESSEPDKPAESAKPDDGPARPQREKVIPVAIIIEMSLFLLVAIAGYFGVNAAVEPPR